MTFFRELSKRLPGVVGILFLVYLGALLYAPHPSGWEHVLRQIFLWAGLVMVLVLFIAALAVGVKAVVARTARVFRGGTPGSSDPIERRSDASSQKKGFFAKIAGGVDKFTIEFFDISFSNYWYSVIFAYGTYQLVREHSYLFAAASLLCCLVLGIDSIVRLAKEPGFFNRLWFGYMFLGLTLLNVCVDASKPDDLASVVMNVIIFGLLSFAGFYGHYRSGAESEGRVGDVISLER